MRRSILFGALLALAFGCGGDEPHRSDKRLLVLGVDGMDPQLARQYMAEGRMPNLKKLAERGGFVELGTSNPPQSPVAWSNVITGAESDVHGIYDFVHRDPDILAPYLSTSRTEAEEDGLFGLIPGTEEMKLLRRGEAFWETLDRAGVPATVVKMPAHFPPAPAGSNEVLAGMGTPDVMGTPGTFQVLTDDPSWLEKRVSGGIIQPLEFASDHKATGVLEGPTLDGSAITAPTTLVRDPSGRAAVIEIGDAKVLLEVGEWSEWTPVSFEAGMFTSLPGIARLYLKSLEPHVLVYVSPINLDPIDPVMPISSPESYAKGLARDAGRFYTQGMPEDTKALGGGVLSDDEFLVQADIIFDESVRQLDRELARFDETGGLLFFYFSSIDQTSHVFYRALADDANAHDRQYAHVLPDLYAKMDAVIGQAIERVGPNTPVIVMSDHGFAPYRRHVHLNTWLANRGYLTLHEGGERGEGALGHIDWANTQAYVLGLNQLFVNLQGREKHGAVAPEDKEMVLRRLERELEGFRDPDTGATVVSRVFRPADGAFPERQPDLIVGFARGYRMSESSATGMVGDAVVTDNTDKWAGDHCMDPALVPGVLFSSEAITGEPVGLTDIAPTILRYFGVQPPAQMKGASVFASQRGS